MSTSPALATLPAAAGAARRHLLSLPDFRRLWTIGLVVFAVRWLEMLVVGVFVYQHTGSAFQVAMMTLLRMAPMVLFGPVIGAVAERFERRNAQILVGLILLLSAVAVAALACFSALEVWHLAVASFVNGIAWAADNPVRRVMIGEVVGAERMGSAMAIDVGANNASRMLGPTVGGLMLAHIGIAGAFSVSVACYALALIAALRLQHRNAMAPAAKGSVLAHIIEGCCCPARPAPRRGANAPSSTTLRLALHQHDSVIGQDSRIYCRRHWPPASMDGIGAFIGRSRSRCGRGCTISTGSYRRGTELLVLVVGFALAPDGSAGSALLLTGLANSDSA